jgi:hypothetical protein
MGRTKVVLVLDQNYGEKLKDLARRAAVWIIDTPSNNTVARILWNSEPKLPHVITTFTPPKPVDDSCFDGLMDEIELHHGHYSQTPPFEELEVIGLESSPMIDAVLGDYGFTRVENTAMGFRAVRSLETRT